RRRAQWARDRLRARVLDPVRLQRPAVVLSLLDQIQLVAPTRAVLDLPEVSLRVEREPLWIAVAARPDLRLRVGLADERIVLWYRAVRTDADHLAEMSIEPLRVGAHRRVRPFAERRVQHPVRPERDARAEVLPAVVRRHDPEDHLHPVHLGPVGRQRAARDGGAVAAVPRLGEGPEDRAVLSERRAERHIEQPALAPRRDWRQPG